MPTFKVIWSVKKYKDTIPPTEGLGEVENAEQFAADNPDCYVISPTEYYSEFYVWMKSGKTKEEVIENLKPKNSVMLEIYEVGETEGMEIPLLEEFVRRQAHSSPTRAVTF